MKNIKLQLSEMRRNISEPDNNVNDTTPQRLTKNILDLKKLKSYNLSNLSRNSVQNPIGFSYNSQTDMVVGGKRIVLPKSTKLPEITKSYKFSVSKGAQNDLSRQNSIERPPQQTATGSSISFNEDLIAMLDEKIEGQLEPK